MVEFYRGVLTIEALMRTPSLHSYRPTPLAACLSIALGLVTVSAPLRAANRPVQICVDGGAGSGSLRDVITNIANPGDTVDLSSLPTICGMANSTITLTLGEIVVAQENLTLQGPIPGMGTVAISGNNTSRVFKHTGYGTLSINTLTVEEGFAPWGGCIYSKSNVFLSNSIVANCVASNPNDFGATTGGGISVGRNAILIQSKVSGNKAISPQGGYGIGGGIFSQAGALTFKYSTISNNLAGDDGVYVGQGGGAVALNGDTYIFASTIDHNQAGRGSGLYLGHTSVTILDSTISNNVGNYAALLSTDSATLSNSTIAFNHAPDGGDVGGISFHGFSASSSMILRSSVLANNTAGPNNAPTDLHVTQGILSGQNNLVMMATGLPPPQGVIEITSDPELGPLQFNGGKTHTHALLLGSPAISQGDNASMLDVDQRGSGYPRTTGPNALVDIGAFQFDSIFADDFDW